MSETITYSEYRQEIKALARSIEEECREYGREAGDVLHETIDGHQWVIYTHHARTVLQMSDNDEAVFDGLWHQEWSGWGEAFTRGAFFAMYEDVAEELDLDACDPTEGDDHD